MLLRALERVESGESQGIVVAKLDRFGRSLLDGLNNIERIQAAGGTFVSVQDGFDLATPTGKFVLRTMLNLAQLESERVAETWSVARQRAVARGAYLSAQPPAGYRRAGDSRLHVDSKAALLIRQVFRRRAAGASVRDLCRFLDESGLRTGRGNGFWTDASVRGILGNRAYLGESSNDAYINRSAHEPLIDAATWQAAQLPRQVRSGRRRSPLSGLLRCAACSMAMHQSNSSDQEMRIYRCEGNSSQGRCPARAVIHADELEPLIEEHFFYLLPRRPRPAPRRLATCEQNVEEAEKDLAAYRDNPKLLRTLGEERFSAGLARRTARLERALLQLAAARRADEDQQLDAAQLEGRWSELSIDERRQLMALVIDCLFIRGQSGPATERVHVCLHGEEPIDLPRPGGHRQEGIHPFQFARRPRVANRLRQPRQWSERRIREKLSEFLKERDDWPGYDEFQAAGQARLWHQVMGYGGPWFWSNELGAKVRHRYGVPRWNRERLRAALTPFLRRLDHWPLQSEFDAAGPSALRKAVHCHGGASYWAAEFDLPRRDRRQGAAPYWTEERVEAELRQLAARSSTYPTPTTFAAAGLRGLYTVIDKRWGHNYWAQRLGLTRARHRART